MTKFERKLSIESLAPVGRPTGGVDLAAYDRTGVFTTISLEPDGGLGFDLHEFWRILDKWKWLVAGIAAAFLIAGLLWTLMVTPLYTSTVRLQIDRNAATIVEGGNVMPVEPPFDFEFLKTQYEILQSHNIAERVAAITHLASDPDFNKQAGFSLSALFGGSEKSARKNKESSQEGAAVQAILGNHVVHPLAGSKLVDVSYSDPSPERAQRIAAAYGEAFIAFNLDRRFQINSYARLFLEDQIKQLKLRLEEVRECSSRVCRERKDRFHRGQNVHCRKQFGERQRSAWKYHLGAHQERTAMASGRVFDGDQSAPTSHKQSHQRLARPPQSTCCRLSGKIGDLPAKLSGDDAD